MMIDLGLNFFSLEINSFADVFEYRISFCLGTDYHAVKGTAPSIEQCYSQAMAYLAKTVREAV